MLRQLPIPYLPPDTSAAADFRVYVLGTPVLLWANTPFSIARRQARALLYRLASDLNPVARTELVYLFWPDMPDLTARRHLTHLLTRLRQDIPDPRILIATPDHVTLDPERVWIDSSVFMHAVATTDPEHRLEALDHAVTLVRGPFLHGVALADAPEFELWLAQERSNWENRTLAVLDTLLEQATVVRNYPLAIRTAQQSLALNPLAEDVHRHLIGLYATIGDRGAAVRHFEHCRTLLEQELGVTPLPETLAIYEQVRAGQSPFPSETAGQRGLILAGNAVTHPVDFPARPESVINPDSADEAPVWAPDVTEKGQMLVTKPLYGRDAEVAIITTMLASAMPRLITLNGPGGSGKTHLAQQIAASVDFPDGVVWVALGSLRVPGLLRDAIAYACGVRTTGWSAASAAVADQLHTALQPKHMLLVLDNAEHLLDGTGVIAELLVAAPNLRVLVTSRVALNLPGEQLVPVPPLPVPSLATLPPIEQLALQPAVALLIHRVRERQPWFMLSEENAADIAAICVRLDGLPLALELASTRLITLTPGAVLARLNHRLTLLTRGPHILPERQQTLRATIDWSHRLLDLSAQAMFANLAVFAGGWSLAAAAAVMQHQMPAAAPVPDEIAVLDLMHGLLEHNMIFSIPGEEPRFDMLDTLREYAQEQLKARGGAGTADEAHATFYRELALRATLHIQGEQSTAWLTMLALDHDNLRVALAWFLGQPDGGAGAIDITNILQVLWRWRGEYHEARHWIPQVLDHSRGLASEKHIHLLMIAGSAAAFYGDRDTALDWFTEGLDLCRDVAAPLIESDLLINMGRIYCYRGDFVHGCALSEAALVLSRKTEDPLHLVRTIRNLAAALCGGLVNIERGMALFEEGLIIARATVDSGAYSQVTLAIFLIDFGSYLALTNQHTRAAMLLAEALALAEQNDHAIARVNALGSLGFLALLQSDRATACRYFLDSQQLINGISAPMNTVMNIEGLAEVAAEKHPRLAIQLLAATSAARTALDMQIEPIEQRHRAQVLADLRHELGDEEFSIAWYQGQDWTVEQALAAARTDTGEKQG